MATSLKNILPDYESLIKEIAQKKMELRVLNELKQTRITHRGNTLVWGYSEHYEWRSKWRTTEDRLHSLESTLQALEERFALVPESLKTLCVYYQEDEAHLLAQLEQSLKPIIEILGNGHPDQLSALLKQKDIAPDITFPAWVNPRAEPLEALNKLSAKCTLRVESETVRLKFVYEDNPEEAVSHSNIIYWLYDNHPQRPDTLEQDADTFFEQAQIMLPIGVGPTDKNGYLIQSIALPESLGLHQINRETNQLMVKPKLSSWKETQLISKAHYDRKVFEDARQGELNQWTNSKAFNDVLLNYNGQFRSEMSETQYLSSLNTRRPLLQHKDVLSVADQVMLNLVVQGFANDDLQAAENAMKQHGWRDYKARELARKVTNQYFYNNRRYGFMLYPIDRGHFVTKDLTTLTGQAGPAWAAPRFPDPDYSQSTPFSTIKIYCTLPEWDKRLCKKLAKLEKAQQYYQHSIEPHQKNILRLQQMEKLTSLYSQYHDTSLNEDEAKTVDGLANNLGQMSGAIEQWLQDSIDTHDFPLAQLKKHINDAAEDLWALLDSPALAKELERYLASSAHSMENTQQMGPGPDMVEEPFWPHIFDTLAKCYAAFRNTSLEGTVWEQHLKSSVLWVANNREREKLDADRETLDLITDDTKKFYFDEDEDNNILVPLIKRITKETKTKLADKSARTPLLITLESYSHIAGTLFHNQPGPPSMMQVVLDVYADYVSKLVRKHSVGKNSLHIKLFFGVMRLYGISPQGADFHSFKNSIYRLLRAHGRQYAPGGKKPKGGKNVVSNEAMKVINDTFSRYFPEIQKNGRAVTSSEGASFSDQAYSARSYKRYKSAMQVMNWMLLFESWGNLTQEGLMDEEGVLRYIGNTLDCSGNTFIKAVQARELIGQYLAARGVNISAPSNALALADTIAQRLNILAGVMATADAWQHYKHGLYGRSIKDIASAASLGMMTYGHAIKKGAQSVVLRSARNKMLVGVASILFIPFVGDVALVAGTIVATGLMLADMVNVVSGLLRSPVHTLFHTYWNLFNDSHIKINKDTKKNCLDFYTGEMPTRQVFKTHYNDAHSQRETLLIEDSAVDWTYLTWRAIIPLYLAGYSSESIQNIVRLPEGAQLYSGGRIQKKGNETMEQPMSTFMDVKSIIEFYHILKKFEKSIPYDTERNSEDVVTALEKGRFIPKLNEPQPTFNIRSQRGGGVSASVSWQHSNYLN